MANKIELGGFQEIIANVQKLTQMFEGMSAAIKNTNTQVKNAAAGGDNFGNNGPLIPVNKGKGVYKSAGSSGNILTFPNSTIDPDSIKEQIQNSQAQHNEVTKASRQKSFGGFNIQSMIEGRQDPAIKIAKASMGLNNYNSNNYGALTEKLNNSKQIEAQLLGRSINASTSRIDDLKAKFGAAKEGMSDKTGKDLELAIKNLAKISDKLANEQGKLADTTKQANSIMGFGGGEGGGPTGFLGNLKNQFRGVGGFAKGMGIAAGAAGLAATGFGMYSSDLRNQSSLYSNLSGQQGQLAGIFNQRLQGQADLTNPENLIKYYGNVAFGRSFEGGTKDGMFKYLGQNGKLRAEKDARTQTDLGRQAENSDLGASIMSAIAKIGGGAAAGALGGGILGPVGAGIGAVGGGLTGAYSGIKELLNSKVLERNGGLRGLTGLGDQDIAKKIQDRYLNEKTISELMRVKQFQEDDLEKSRPIQLGVSEINKGIAVQRAGVSGLGARSVNGLENYAESMKYYNDLEMGASEFAQARNSLSMTKFKGQASFNETDTAIRMGRGGLGSFEQIAGNLQSLQGASNASGLDNLKKVFAEAFASGFKNSGMVQQFAATAMSLTSGLGVTNVNGIARGLTAGSRMYQGMGDNASIAMQNAAQGMQQGNAFSTTQGGMAGHMRAYGIMMGGGGAVNSQSMFNKNTEQLNQMQDELQGKSKMSSETLMQVRALQAKGMTEKEAKTTVLKQISGSFAGTRGALDANLRTGFGMSLDDVIKRFPKASKLEQEKMLGAVNMAGANVAGLGEKGGQYLVRQALGSTGASTKAVDAQIAAGNETFRDVLNKRRQEYINKQTGGTALEMMKNPDTEEYKAFLNANGNKGIKVSMGGRVQELTASMLGTKEGQAALKTIQRRDLAAAAESDGGGETAPTQVIINDLSTTAVRSMAMAFNLKRIDAAAPEVD